MRSSDAICRSWLLALWRNAILQDDEMMLFVSLTRSQKATLHGDANNSVLTRPTGADEIKVAHSVPVFIEIYIPKSTWLALVLLIWD